MFCMKCGAELPETAIFCNKCGTRIEAINEYTENMNIEVNNNDHKWAAWVSFIIGITSLLTFIIIVGAVLPLFGIPVGVYGLIKSKSKGLALIGLCMNLITLLFSIAIIIIGITQK